MNRSFAAFLGLFLLSVTVLFFLPEHDIAKGFLLLLWAGFGLVRFLWVGELVFFGKLEDEESQADTLAGALENNRHRAVVREECYRASNAFSDKTLIWLALAAAYGIWVSASIFFHAVHPAYSALTGDIADYLHAFAFLPFEVGYYVPASDFAVGIVVVLAYVLAQSFATSQAQGRVLIAVALAVFCVVVVWLGFTATLSIKPPVSGQWIGYGPGSAEILQSMELIPPQRLSSFDTRVYEIGLAGNVFLYLIGLYQLLLFLGALGRDRSQKISAVAGLAVLMVLVLGDRVISATSTLEALWLSGWVALAVLSVHSRFLGVRQSKLRQI